MLVHPDREELAAYQAGALDERARARLEAHVPACAACTATVSALAGVERQLAELPEPEPPPGFHDRLAAALAAEQGRIGGRRRLAWYQRPAAWGAAAALLLAVAGFSNLVGSRAPSTAGGGEANPEAATRAQPAPPAAAGSAAQPQLVFLATGEYSVGRLRDDLRQNVAMRRAYEAAARGVQRAGPAAAGADRSDAAAAGAAVGSQLAQAGVRADDPAACLAQVGPDGAAAFFVAGEGLTVGGQPVELLLVTVGRPSSDPDRDRVRLWVVPDGTCAKPLRAVGETAAP